MMSSWMNTLKLSPYLAAVAEVGESNGHEVEEEEEGACEDSDGGTSLELRLVPEDVSKC